jgi:hypothetical protein
MVDCADADAVCPVRLRLFVNIVHVYVVADGTIVDPLFAAANEKVLPVQVVTD